MLCGVTQFYVTSRGYWCREPAMNSETCAYHRLEAVMVRQQMLKVAQANSMECPCRNAVNPSKFVVCQTNNADLFTIRSEISVFLAEQTWSILNYRYLIKLTQSSIANTKRYASFILPSHHLRKAYAKLTENEHKKLNCYGLRTACNFVILWHRCLNILEQYWRFT